MHVLIVSASENRCMWCLLQLNMEQEGGVNTPFVSLVQHQNLLRFSHPKSAWRNLNCNYGKLLHLQKACCFSCFSKECLNIFSNNRCEFLHFWRLTPSSIPQRLRQKFVNGMLRYTDLRKEELAMRSFIWFIVYSELATLEALRYSSTDTLEDGLNLVTEPLCIYPTMHLMLHTSFRNTYRKAPAKL